MTDKLKPVRCGCGGAVICIRGKDMYWKPGGLYEVHCLGCGLNTKLYATEAEAIRAWNRAMSRKTAKVETVEKPNTYKCSECGQYFHQTSWGSPVEYCSRCGARLEWE